MNLDAVRNRHPARFAARPLTVTEKSELGNTIRWRESTFKPGRLSPDVSATVRFETFRRELKRAA